MQFNSMTFYGALLSHVGLRIYIHPYVSDLSDTKIDITCAERICPKQALKCG